MNEVDLKKVTLDKQAELEKATFDKQRAFLGLPPIDGKPSEALSLLFDVLNDIESVSDLEIVRRSHIQSSLIKLKEMKPEVFAADILQEFRTKIRRISKTNDPAYNQLVLFLLDEFSKMI